MSVHVRIDSSIIDNYYSILCVYIYNRYDDFKLIYFYHLNIDSILFDYLGIIFYFII